MSHSTAFADNTFRWLGAAGVELCSAGRHLLIDPYITRFGLLRQWIGRVRPNDDSVAQTLPICDVVLVTHSHWDHLLDVPGIQMRTSAVAVGSANTIRLLQILGVPKAQLRLVAFGEQLILHDFNVEVFEGHHAKAPGFGPGSIGQMLKPPLRARDYRMDVLFSYRIQVDGTSFVTEPGDNPITARESQILLTSPRYSRETLSIILTQIRPEVIVPYHWDNMYRPLTEPLVPMLKPPQLSWPPFGRMNLEEFKHNVAKVDPNVRVFVPEVLYRYRFQDILT